MLKKEPTAKACMLADVDARVGDVMDANGSCGWDAGTGFVAMQNLPESEDDEEGDYRRGGSCVACSCSMMFYMNSWGLAACWPSFYV